MVEVRGESIDGGVGRSRLFVEDSLRSVVRRGMPYTECDAQGLGCLRRAIWSMYGIKGVVSRGWGLCFDGMRSGGRQYVQIVWMEQLQGRDVTGACLAIAAPRLPVLHARSVKGKVKIPKLLRRGMNFLMGQKAAQISRDTHR